MINGKYKGLEFRVESLIAREAKQNIEIKTKAADFWLFGLRLLTATDKL